MYLEIETDDRAAVARLLSEEIDREEASHITVQKIGDAFRLVVSRKLEPPVVTV